MLNLEVIGKLIGIAALMYGTGFASGKAAAWVRIIRDVV